MQPLYSLRTCGILLCGSLALLLGACGDKSGELGELGDIDLATVGAPVEIAIGYAEAIATHGPEILDLSVEVKECWAATDLDEIEEMACDLALRSLSGAISLLKSTLNDIWYNLDDPDWAPDPADPPPSTELSGLALSFPSGPQVGRHPNIEDDGLVARTAVAVDDRTGGRMTEERLTRLLEVMEEWRGAPIPRHSGEGD